MAKKNTAPESPTDVGKQLFKRAWQWWAGRPWWAKILASLAIIIVLFATSRLKFFGEPYYDYARLILPIHLPGVDEIKPAIGLSLAYEIEDSMGRRGGKLGETIYSGDRIYLSLEASHTCWLSVFGVDAKGIHPIFREKLSPSLIEKGLKYTLDFILDETVGNEVYYAVAAHEEFSFEEDIQPYLQRVFPQGHTKGPKFSEYQLSLPPQYAMSMIYFQHANRP